MDRGLFEKWLAPWAPEQCMELNTLLLQHLVEGLAPLPDADSAEEHAPWLDSAWEHVQAAVIAAALAEAARKAEEEGAEEPEPRTAPEGHIGDAELAAWLQSVLNWQGNDELLEVLRDEVTGTLEGDAMQHPVEESGMWAPDDSRNNKSQEDLLEELRQDLAKAVGENAA